MEKTNPSVNHESFRRKTVDKYLRILVPLNDDSRFVLENSVNGIDLSTTHVMYKLVPPQLELVDGRKYEFLIEFDRDDIEWSIYYGCRGLFPDMDEDEALPLFDEEFEAQRQFILKDLRLIGLDVDDDSFEITNNTSNRTYWPFWLKMTGSLKSTVAAVIAIRTNYENYLIYKGLITEDKRSYPDLYDDFLSSVSKDSKDNILELIENMELEGLCEKVSYRHEWKITSTTTDFAVVWRFFCDYCPVKPNDEKTENRWFPNKDFAIWKTPCHFFYNAKGKPMHDLAKFHSQWKEESMEPKSSAAKRVIKKLRELYSI